MSSSALPHNNVLSDDEIRTLWSYFDQLRPNPRDMLQLGLFTAQRPGEIAKMRWEDIDLDTNVWTQRNTKNGASLLPVEAIRTMHPSHPPY